jgi:hypothetical protein
MTSVKQATRRAIRDDNARRGGNGSVASGGLAGRPVRRRPVVALGVIVLVGAMFGFALWSSSLGHRSSVLMARRDIAAGAVIGRADLARVDVGADPAVATVPGSRLDAVVGQVARAAIPAGSLLTNAAFGATTPLRGDQAVVGAVLAPGAVPVPDLRPGQRVEVVAAPSSAAADGSPVQSASTGSPVVAVVWSVSNATAAQGAPGTAVSLLVDRSAAPQVATLAGSGQMRLVLLADAPRGGAGP